MRCRRLRKRLASSTVGGLIQPERYSSRRHAVRLGGRQLRFSYYGSARFLLRSAASNLLKILAGAAAGVSATYTLVTHGPIWVLALGLAVAIILAFAGAVVDAEMGQRVHQRESPLRRTTQALLEEYWLSCRKTLIEKRLWDEDMHVRFVVYIPLRRWFLGASYLMPMHFLDKDEKHNSEDYMMQVRTDSGWAGRVFAEGRPLVADLEDREDLVKLRLSAEQIDFLNQLGLKSKIVVPLMAGPDRIVGVFSVESCAPPEQSKFQNEEVAALIENATKFVFAACDTSYNLRRHAIATNGG